MKVYRYYDVQYSAGWGECGDSLGPGRVGVHLMEYDVIRKTKCDVWIDIVNYLAAPFEMIPKDCLKFINLQANKKYACLTIEEAKESFIARKRRQIRILSAQILRVDKAIIEINIGDTNDSNRN